MIRRSHAHGHYGRKEHHFAPGGLFVRIGRVLFVAVLFILFFWLAESMTSHRFFEGGWIQNGRIRP
jgi:hypothetical protein